MHHKLIKHFDFDAAHRLECHSGKCYNLHGHTWKGSVTIIKKDYTCTQEQPMIMDFKDVACRIKKVTDLLDHQNLNKVLCVGNTTAEFIAKYLFHRFAQEFVNDSRIDVVSVTLYESDGSGITYEK